MVGGASCGRGVERILGGVGMTWKVGSGVPERTGGMYVEDEDAEEE